MTTEIEVRSEQLPPGVYRRPASRYLWIQYHDRGQMVRESAKTTNPKKAAKLRGRRLGELATDEFIGPQQRRVTVAQVLDGYRDNRRLAGTPGLGNIEQRCARLKNSLGGWRAVDVTLPRLETWANEQLAEGYARGTVKLDLAYLRAAFNVTRKRGVVVRGRTVKLKHRPDFPTITVNNAREGFFERHQFDSVSGALRTCGPHGEALADVVTFHFWSGWRLGEILTLPWAYVDRRERLIVLPSTGSTKRKKDRVLPLDFLVEDGKTWANTELWQLIERRWQARAGRSTLNPLVFHRSGRPIRDFRHLWRKACEAAGVQGLVPHDFRRTRVRELTLAGVPEKRAMEWTGHATREVFDRYHIVTATDQRRSLAQLTARAQAPSNIIPIGHNTEEAQSAPRRAASGG